MEEKEFKLNNTFIEEREECYTYAQEVMLNRIEKDVKEFIRLLKEEFCNEEHYKGYECENCQKIDKLSGDLK